MITLTETHKPGSYMRWLASQPCCICGGRPVELHHVSVKDWNLPRRTNNPLRDYTVIPLCGSRHHQHGPEAIHRIGQPAFERLHGVEVDALLLTYYHRYCTACALLPPALEGALELAGWLAGRERRDA